MSTPPGADRVVVGVVAKPFGLNGDVFVRPDPDIEHDFEVGRAYPRDDGDLIVAAARVHSGRLVMRFENFDDRDAAASLRGTVLTVPREDVALGEDAYWSTDLIGREVVDDAGDLIGVVESTRDGAAHDYLLIARPDGGEILLPAVGELMEVEAERIVVHAIPGLLDSDEAW